MPPAGIEPARYRYRGILSRGNHSLSYIIIYYNTLYAIIIYGLCNYLKERFYELTANLLAECWQPSTWEIKMG